MTNTMSSAPMDCRIPDPTDKLAADQFVNRRAGYGDRLERTIATARKGWTLSAGEGAVLVEEIDRLKGELDTLQSAMRETFARAGLGVSRDG